MSTHSVLVHQHAIFARERSGKAPNLRTTSGRSALPTQRAGGRDRGQRVLPQVIPYPDTWTVRHEENGDEQRGIDQPGAERPASLPVSGRIMCVDHFDGSSGNPATLKGPARAQYQCAVRD